LALALLLVHQPNLILLDEPTNHLDMAARAALVEALADFPGAVVLVSHDRALIESCCERYLRVHRGRVVAFAGDLDAYAEALRKETAEAARQSMESATASGGRQPSARDYKERKALANRLKRIEEQVHQLSAAERRAESALAEAAQRRGHDTMELVRLEAERAAAAAAREAAELEWLELAERLESMG
jgi:ATP-binding cassette subfamily F protein 3